MHATDYCTCLGHLRQCDTDRIISILPKVAKASSVVTVACRWRYRAKHSPMKICLKYTPYKSTSSFGLFVCTLVKKCYLDI